MIGPTLHLNGTSFDELMRQYNEVIAALEQSARMIVDACPHGRDYIRREASYKDAMQRHQGRLHDVIEVIQYYQALRDDLQKQQDERNRQKARNKCTTNSQ